MTVGVLHVKHGSTWKAVNFEGTLWVNHSGTWKVPTGAFVRVSGVWKKVYPSDLETWTTAKLPTVTNYKSTADVPELDLISTPPSNMTTAGLLAGWKDRASAGNRGRWMTASSFGWSPTTTVGFGFGAISRIEVTFDARTSTAIIGSEWHKMWVKPYYNTNNEYDTAHMTTSYVLFTFDYITGVAGWDIDYEGANALYLGTNSIKVESEFDNSTVPSDQTAVLRNLKCRIKYKYNSS